mgnify:CR=1 FL=1
MSARTKAKRTAARRQWIIRGAHWFDSPEWRALGKVIRAKVDEQRGDAPDSIDEDGIVARITCGACPVQIEGTADGWPLYLRLRDGGSIGICRAVCDPVGLGWSDPPVLPGAYLDEGGIVDGDGWTPHAEAWRMLREAVAHWRATRGAGWPECATGEDRP